MNLDLVSRGYWTLAVLIMHGEIRKQLFKMHSQNAKCEELI